MTIGACATAGGIQALRNWADHDAYRAAVYAHPEYVESLATATPISDHVAVDAELRGCPIDPGQLLELLTALVVGRRPQLPDEAVCLECKRRGIVCVLVTGVGPVPRAGDPHRLRRPVPGLRARLLRLLRAAREGERRRASRSWFGRDGRSDADTARLFAGFTAYAKPFRDVIDAPAVGPPVATKPGGGRLMHGTHVATGEQRFEVAGLTRVEGEGSLRLVVRDGEVVESQLAIFEAPRYFEQLVVGRTPDEVLDIVARICGICPIAYQMSAVHAFEHLAGVTIDPAVRALRRLLYCGEWIESHALHVYLLHAPDFLGCANAVELAALDRSAVERGLALKKTGNRIVSVLGGRPIHPVSVRVGGFSRVPRPRRARGPAARPRRARSTRRSRRSTGWRRSRAPEFERSERFVALRHPTEYPFNEGRIVSSDGLDLAPTDWEAAFAEEQVPWSHALQARMADRVPYLLGPAARITLTGDRLHPEARAALDRIGLAGEIARNPNWSIAARAVELVHAVAEAIEVLDGYAPPDRAERAMDARAGHRRPGRPRRRAACCSITTSSTSGAGSPARRSSRRRARTRPRSRRTSRPSRRRSWTSPTTSPRTGSRSSSAATTRASRARRTSST